MAEVRLVSFSRSWWNSRTSVIYVSRVNLITNCTILAKWVKEYFLYSSFYSTNCITRNEKIVHYYYFIHTQWNKWWTWRGHPRLYMPKLKLYYIPSIDRIYFYFDMTHLPIFEELISIILNCTFLQHPSFTFRCNHFKLTWTLPDIHCTSYNLPKLSLHINKASSVNNTAKSVLDLSLSRCLLLATPHSM